MIEALGFSQTPFDPRRPGRLCRGRERWIEPWEPEEGEQPVEIQEGQALVLSDADTDLWEVSRQANAVHPTEKPSELARKALENSTQPEEVVLDPFAGSGSTLVGAVQTNRRARLIELMPAYAAVILARAEDLGLTPEKHEP